MNKRFKPVFIFLIALLALVALPFHLFGQEKMNDFEELAKGYLGQGKQELAAEFYSKAGYAYWNTSNSNQAARAFQRAYDLFSAQGNVTAAIAVANNLGLIYLDAEKYKDAYTAFNHVLTYSRNGKNSAELYNALINIGNVAFELSSFNDAVSKTNEALAIAKEMNNLRYIGKCYSLLAECYEKTGDASNAFKYFELYSSIDKKIKAQEMEDVKNMSAEEISKAQEKKRMAEIELKIKKGELKLTQDSLVVSERLAYERQMQVELRNEQLQKKEMQLRYEKNLRRNLIIGIIITALFLLILGFLLRQKLIDNKTLRRQKEEISEQRNKLDIQNKKITDSIHYGLRIQQAMLPDLQELQKKMDVAVMYRPKDIVSGDFYWFHEVPVNNGNSAYCFVAVVDCTGHGVPGAFMSMIGHRLLAEVIIERRTHQPSKILEEINERLQAELDQQNKKSNDGMDVALCRITTVNGQCTEITYAGAKRPLLVYKKETGEFVTVDGDRKGIGGFSENVKEFTDKTVSVGEGDMAFLYSDGIIDQQNMARERFGSIRFNETIQNNINKPLSEIVSELDGAMEKHKGLEEQRDDITVLGIKLN